jgi:hypothetical protein
VAEGAPECLREERYFETLNAASTWHNIRFGRTFGSARKARWPRLLSLGRLAEEVLWAERRTDDPASGVNVVRQYPNGHKGREAMKRLYIAIVFVVGIALATFANADQVKVNIVYPINGANYPITDPATGPLKSAYLQQALASRALVIIRSNGASTVPQPSEALPFMTRQACNSCTSCPVEVMFSGLKRIVARIELSSTLVSKLCDTAL